MSAKSVEEGGADLILVYNSGRFRMAGRGSLAGLMPYSDANKVVVEMVCLRRPFPLLNCDRLTRAEAPSITNICTNLGFRGSSRRGKYPCPSRSLWH